MTSTAVSAIVWPGQVSRAYALRKLFLRAQATHIGPVGIERLGQAVENAERPKYPEQVLQADAPVATLQAAHRIARYPGPVGELSLGQAPQLSPCRKVIRDAAKRTTDRRGNCAGRMTAILTFSFTHDISGNIAVKTADNI
jgi:hypothetical protein